jgi:GTPase SAR1 family protein
VLVYDVTSEESLQKLENWKSEFINQGGIDNPDKFPFIVIGNKADRSDRAVDQETTSKFCEDNGNLKAYETSAKEGSGINEAMEEIVRQANQHRQEEEEEIFIPREINLGEETGTRHGNGSYGDCGC